MPNNKTLLIIGASRGLGLGLAKEFLARGWSVVGTVREGSGTKLHDLLSSSAGKLAIESLDITEVAQIAALKGRLAGKAFDILFVNAGVANDRLVTIGEITTEEFVRLFVTNTLSTMRVVEALADNVTAKATIGEASRSTGRPRPRSTRSCEASRPVGPWVAP
jgi:NAD(P)-dependent dehydrogenase (short-subunit alcohol dehydrogenase family)